MGEDKKIENSLVILDNTDKLIEEESLNFDLLEDCSLDNSVAILDNIATEYLIDNSNLQDDFMRLKKYIQESGQMHGLLQELVLKV